LGFINEDELVEVTPWPSACASAPSTTTSASIRSTRPIPGSKFGTVCFLVVLGTLVSDKQRNNKEADHRPTIARSYRAVLSGRRGLQIAASATTMGRRGRLRAASERSEAGVAPVGFLQLLLLANEGVVVPRLPFDQALKQLPRLGIWRLSRLLSIEVDGVEFELNRYGQRAHLEMGLLDPPLEVGGEDRVVYG